MRGCCGGWHLNLHAFSLRARVCNLFLATTTLSPEIPLNLQHRSKRRRTINDADDDDNADVDVDADADERQTATATPTPTPLPDALRRDMLPSRRVGHDWQRLCHEAAARCECVPHSLLCVCVCVSARK